MNLEISDWASIAEIIGTVAVIVSLVFVGLQIRANAVATQSATYQDSVGHEIDILLAIAATPESATNHTKFLMDPSALDEGAHEQAQWTFMATMRLWENMYHQWQAGTLSHGGWAAREPLVRELLRSPPADDALQYALFSGQFMEYVREVRSETTS